MFTGIIEEIGEIAGVKRGQVSSRLAIRGKKIFSDLKLGDSVAVNGVCLTATSISGDIFEADVMAGRFGGHIVSGHIDGTGRVSSLVREENAVWVRIDAEDKILRYIIEKGSIAIDGISLTVAETGPGYFKVSIIPHTGEETTLLRRRPGDIVNLENDVVGKYVERLLNFSAGNGEAFGQKAKAGGIDLNLLSENGFL